MKSVNQKTKLVVPIFVVIICMIGISYAAWILNFQQTKKNIVATGCFDVALTSNTESLDLQKAYPILDEDGSNLKPYTFTITNNCASYASYQVNLEVLKTSTLTNTGFVKIMLNNNNPILLSNNEVIEPSLTEAITSYKLTTGYLDKKESETYDLRIWLDENVDMEDAVNNLLFKTKITVTASYATNIPTPYETCTAKYGTDSLQCSILSSVDTSGNCPAVNSDGTIAVNSIEATKSLLCGAPDDYGNSYYFRGVVENNWVKFGGYYWRILRVNGDNSIRMIYAGDASVIDALDETTKAQVLSNGYDDSSTLYTQIGKSRYNYYWKKDNVQESLSSPVYADNAGVGYMYGNRDGITEGTTEYSTSSWTSTNTYYVSEEYSYDVTTDKFTLKNPIAVLASEMTSDYVGYYTHSKTSSSTSYNYIYKITSVSVGESKTTVGYSYVRYGTTSKEQAQTNTNDSTIKAYIDNWYETNLSSYESYISDTLFCNDRTIQETIPSGYSNLGYGVEKTAYRWYDMSSGVKLLSSNQNDRFTMDDEIVGNGDLTYPIGLITAPEVWLAGGNLSNSTYYLYTGNNYYTMTPNYFSGSGSRVQYVGEQGELTGTHYTNNVFGVRPVINLKPGVLNSGSGLWNDPYKIVE